MDPLILSTDLHNVDPLIWITDLLHGFTWLIWSTDLLHGFTARIERQLRHLELPKPRRRFSDPRASEQSLHRSLRLFSSGWQKQS